MRWAMPWAVAGCSQLLGLSPPTQAPADASGHDGHGPDTMMMMGSSDAGNDCGAPSASFGTAIELAQSGYVWHEVGDINKDGVPDVVVATSTSPSLHVFLGTDSAALLTPGSSFAPGSDCDAARAIAIADVDGDGYNDLLVGCQGSVYYLRQLEAKPGTFAPGVALPGLSVSSDFGGIAVGDIDNNGFNDVVTTTGAALFYAMQSGSNAFTAGTPFPIDGSPGAPVVADLLAVGDFTGDGLADVLYLDGGNLELDVQGSAGLASPRQFGVPDTEELVAADFDGDGHLDILTRQQSGMAMLYTQLVGWAAAVVRADAGDAGRRREVRARRRRRRQRRPTRRRLVHRGESTVQAAARHVRRPRDVRQRAPGSLR